jgi:hypothetical protein
VVCRGVGGMKRAASEQHGANDPGGELRGSPATGDDLNGPLA